MLKKQSVLRAAAVSAAALFVTVGAVGPVYAGGEDGRAQDRPSAAPHRTEPPATARSSSKGRGPKAEKAPERGDGSKADPPRHDPVTVCHLLGNGSYHLLTFDDSALKAHLGHGDLYPVPADGCPSDTQGVGTSETTGRTPTTSDVVATRDVVRTRSALLAAVRPVTGPEAEALRSVTAPRVLGREATVAPRAATVLGVEATRAAGPGTTASRPAARVAPVAGVLPQTGAGRLGLALFAGLSLVAAGASLLVRRRARVG